MANFKPSLSASETLKLIECPVCFETACPPIYQCNNGHIICNSCVEMVHLCPVCRTAMPQVRIRSLMVEQFTAHITQIECQNAKHGCKVKGKQEDLENHILGCDYSPREFCNALGFGNLLGCTKAITKHGISVHMKNEHNIGVVESSHAKIVQEMEGMRINPGFQKWLPITFSVFNEHFFIVSELSKKANDTTAHVSWKCIIAAPVTISRKYSVELKLSKPEKNLQWTWQGPVISIDDMFKDVNYLTLPLDTLHLFNQGTEGTVEWEIVVFIRQIGQFQPEVLINELNLMRTFLISAHGSSTAMNVSSIAGTYEMVDKRKHYDCIVYCETFGTTWTQIFLRSHAKPIMSWVDNGNGNWTQKAGNYINSTSEITFTLGVEFNEVIDGGHCTSVITIEGNKLIHKIKLHILMQTEIVREFNGNEMTSTFSYAGQTAIIKYKKIA